VVLAHRAVIVLAETVTEGEIQGLLFRAALFAVRACDPRPAAIPNGSTRTVPRWLPRIHLCGLSGMPWRYVGARTLPAVA